MAVAAAAAPMAIRIFCSVGPMFSLIDFLRIVDEFFDQRIA
jgi:hypothetical protein